MYTSFLFNLLANSLKIRSIAVTLQKAQDDKNWVDFTKSMASLLRICVDFSSSNAEGKDPMNMIEELNNLRKQEQQNTNSTSEGANETILDWIMDLAYD